MVAKTLRESKGLKNQAKRVLREGSLLVIFVFFGSIFSQIKKKFRLRCDKKAK